MENESDDLVHKEEIRNYYNYTRRFYRVFWHGNTNSLHYGFYNESVKDHKEALLKTIEMTAKAGDISINNLVADLGCGVGGSAFWIAKNIGAKVEGITLSSEQFKKAEYLREINMLTHLTSFKVGDFFQTGYEGGRFDVVFGIESLCYGQYNIRVLAQELYRITKEGGKLIVTDGYLGQREIDQVTGKKVKYFEEGFAVKKLITVKDFTYALEQAGFKNIKFTDWTENILPTARKMHNLTRKWHWFIKAVTKLGIIPDMILKNNITGQIQLELFNSRVLVYGCITAEK